MVSTLLPAAAGFALGLQSLESERRIEALPWLSGTLLRNGPARFEVGRDNYRHWFDGLAMLHRFTFAAGGVSYANRFLRSKRFAAAERAGHIVGGEFGTVAQLTFADRLRAPFGNGLTDNANVNIVPFRDGYLALTETPGPVAFDGETLETRGTAKYDDALSAPLMTAHTHHDPARRATFNVVIEMGRKSRYSVVRIPDGTLRRTVIASIAVDEPAYLHAFSTTARYVIIAEYPLVVRPLDLLFGRKPFIENYRWKPDRATRFHVVDKDTGASAGVYETAAFFAFHHINAYDDGAAVVIDICAYDDHAIISDFTLDRLRAGAGVSRPSVRRYRLIPGRSAAEVETISEVSLELPRVAPLREAGPYRFAYGFAGAAERPEFSDRIVKVDLASGSVSSWSQTRSYPGEPVFVARPGGTDEDDGVLLSVVLDAAAGSSYVVVLDARTLEECARAAVPHHIPFGFHGIFR